MAAITSRFSIGILLVSSVVLLGACTGEKDKGKKVADYFATFGLIPHIDQFDPGVVTLLPVIKASSKHKTLESPGHIIQCDDKGCFDPMSTTKKLIPYSSPSFTADFEKQLLAFLTKGGEEYCGIEFLAFAAQLKNDQLMPILGTLKKFHCDVIIISQQLRKLPPWPKLDKKSQPKLTKVLQLPAAKQPAAAKKLLASFGKHCPPIEKFVTDTIKIKPNERRELLNAILSDYKAKVGLDDCKRSSAQLITELRIHLAGFAESEPDLFMKKIAFVDSPKEADMTFSAKHVDWSSFAVDAFKIDKDPLNVALETSAKPSPVKKAPRKGKTTKQ